MVRDVVREVVIRIVLVVVLVFWGVVGSPCEQLLEVDGALREG